MKKKISIKSFNGVGDLLFATPSLRVIKIAYPDSEIIFNTNYPSLLQNNPFVDQTGSKNEGIFLGYDDPIHGKHPDRHHIYKDWQIICSAYNLDTSPPALKPEIHFNYNSKDRLGVGVQVIHKGHWHKKKVWPWFETLTQLYPWVRCSEVKPIPKMDSVVSLVKHIASLRLVVCAEGGISHIAKAVNTPAIVLYGGFALPEWNGYEDQINLCNYPPCGPCYNAGPCTGSYERECFTKITPAYVAGEIERILSS